MVINSKIVLLYLIFFVVYLPLFSSNINKKRCALEPCKEEIVVTSPSFIFGGKIDTKHASNQCDGKNIPFDVKWSKINEAKSYVIIIDDPDAPARKNPNPMPFVHAVFFD